MNYTELKSLLEGYLENSQTDFVGELDTFIRLAEEKIVRFVKHPVFRKIQQATFTASDGILTKPGDFLTPYQMKVIDGTTTSFLIPVEPGFIEEAYPDSSYEAKPRYYALRDNTTFIVGPIPDQAYSVHLDYYYSPESIVTATTTWIGDNCENALLYGCLSEAYRYMKGAEDLQVMYKTEFREALADFAKLGMDRQAIDEFFTPIESI